MGFPLTKTFRIVLYFGLGLFLISQDLQHEAVAVNIEVPVRVFRGDEFVETLTMDDFQVLEDGELQRIDAVYLIKRTAIRREEQSPSAAAAGKNFSPEVARNFILLFEIQEYLPKLEEAIDFFFAEIITPADTLRVVTPMKTYLFKPRALALQSAERIAQQLKEKLKIDTRDGNADYRALMKDLRSVREMDVEADLKALMYSEILSRLKTIKYVDEKRLLDFADFLKKERGQKHVFLFYQKEMVPLLGGGISTTPFSEQGFEVEMDFDVLKVKQAFADSTISSHFLYITNPPEQNLDVTEMQALSSRGVQWYEVSQDIFSAFREVAVATGGITDSSANPAFSFKKAVEASENYYLLYYSPKVYVSDGNFKTIEVRVKGGGYRVLHRAGYVAD